MRSAGSAPTTERSANPANTAMAIAAGIRTPPSFALRHRGPACRYATKVTHSVTAAKISPPDPSDQIAAITLAYATNTPACSARVVRRPFGEPTRACVKGARWDGRRASVRAGATAAVGHAAVRTGRARLPANQHRAVRERSGPTRLAGRRAQ